MTSQRCIFGVNLLTMYINRNHVLQRCGFSELYIVFILCKKSYIYGLDEMNLRLVYIMKFLKKRATNIR